MAKKKKASKGSDARGYGQTTVFRVEPTPKIAAITSNTRTTQEDADAANVDAPPAASVVLDDWDTANEQDEKEIQALISKPMPPVKKIPPSADVKLPILANKKSPSTILLSTTMHELLEELVRPMPWQSFIGTSEMETYRSDRYIKKIAFLYDYLLVAGFAWDHILSAVATLGRANLSIDLDTTLDWLCYSLDSTVLPMRFLDEREASIQSQARKEEEQKEKEAKLEAVDDQPGVVEEETKTIVATKVTRNHSLSVNNNEHIKLKPEVEEPEISDAPIVAEKTKDEERLEEMEKSFAEVTHEYNDEASKYMMSKYEVKELEKRYKQMKKEVDRLKIKIQKARDRRKAEEEVAAGNEKEEQEEQDEDLGEDEPAFGGFFDDDPEDAMETADSDNNPSTSLPHIHVPKDAIPTSWTGKTPKEILEERCRNLKLQRPTFQNLGQYGYRVAIKGQAGVDVEERAIFDTKMDGQNYVATKALYKLDPTLPIHRSLPPFYRDLWKGWVNEVQNAKDEHERAKEDKRKQNILELLSHVPEQNTETQAVEDLENDDGVDMKRTDPLSDSALDPSAKNNPDNQRLKVDFESRCKTKQYQSMLKQRMSLPIYDFKENILDTVASCPVTVLCAETGAGKTTQCPQFLLEHSLKSGRGGSTSILCTQPRRVAATSVAERVSEEMCTKVGDQVGYSIRLENRRSNQTRLLFCTTGVILRRLIEDPLLTGVSHVIVDEVHERQWQIDVLLVALRRLVNGPRRDLKIVLMSATLDAKLFCSFFSGAPLVSVPGRTFPVSNYFLEDLIEATGHIVEDGSPNALRNYQRSEKASLNITTKGGGERKQMVSLDSEVDPTLSEDFSGYSLTTRWTMDRVDESVLNYDLIEDVLHLLLVEKHEDHAIKAPDGTSADKGAVLVFLPGIGEIRTLSDRLQASSNFRDRRTFDIIPMHSALSSTEQRRAFLVPRKVRWAIIVATNIAETSITIPDAVCGKSRTSSNSKVLFGDFVSTFFPSY